MDELRQKLAKPYKGDGLAHAVVITGHGGSGKSQLAHRLIESDSSIYDPVLWIDAQSVESIRSSFERCRRALGILAETSVGVQEPLHDLASVQAVLHWLKTRTTADPEWLVVVDNLDELLDDQSLNLPDIIPRGARGTVVITSIDQQVHRVLGTKSEILQVHSMEIDEAMALFSKRLDSSSGIEHEQFRKSARDVVVQLEMMPLAVDIAGAQLAIYVEGNMDATSAAQRYLADYCRHRDDLLRRGSSFTEVSSYKKTAWTVLETSLTSIESKYGGNPSQLLTFMTFFSRTNIQDEMFRLASQGLHAVYETAQPTKHDLPGWLCQLLRAPEGESWDDFEYRQARDALLRYGLLRWTADREGTSMHTLVQWRARPDGADDEWLQWFLLFLTAASRAVLADDTKTSFRQHITAHFPSASRLISMENSLAHKAYLNLIEAVRGVWYRQAQWAEAEKLQVKIVEVLSDSFGEDDRRTMTSKATLRSIYALQGRFMKAERLGAKVMESQMRLLGKNHSDTLDSIAEQAEIFIYQERFWEADKLLSNAVEIVSGKYGEESPTTLDYSTRLAFTYYSEGRWVEAEDLQSKLMEKTLRLLGRDHPTTLINMLNLATNHRSQGRWQEAEKLDIAVTEGNTRVFGKDHPYTLASLANLAATYDEQGRWKEAEELGMHVLEARRKILGENHPDTLTSMGNLALTYRKQGRWARAEELQLLTIKGWRKVLGEEHARTLVSIATLAATYFAQGSRVKAEDLTVQVLEAMKKVLGEEHLDTLRCMVQLATICYIQGRSMEAEKLGVHVLKTRTRVLGEEHCETLESMEGLAFVCHMQERAAEAEALLVRVVETRERVLGKEHPDTLTSLDELAFVLEAQGKCMARTK
ncbi:hypothetical protein LTR27_009431 [Elasticomyces elasticus]|nr:hypothetical protein LTR27_009431 [Elasticomyces elasticus]